MSKGDVLRYDGRVAVITGAGRGLGRAYAELLADRGMAVVVNDVGADPDGRGKDRGPADEVASRIRAIGGTAVADHHDVSDPEEGAAIVGAAMAEFGRIDVLIHNAGMARATLDRHLDVHLAGGVHVSRAAWPYLCAQRYGRILFTTSGAGLYGYRGGPDYGDLELYGIAKMAEVGLMRHLALRGSELNINVNAIAPGAYTRAVDVARQLWGSSERIDWVRRRATPEMVAPVAAWLVHEACTVNGAIYKASGGRVARVFIAETKGYINTDLTIEDVRDNVSLIDDVTGFYQPASATDSPEIELGRED